MSDILNTANGLLKETLHGAPPIQTTMDLACEVIRLEARVKQLEAESLSHSGLIEQQRAALRRRKERYEKAESKVKEFEAERNNATQTKVCHWELEDDDAATYQGECGVLWYIPEGDPKENKMNYCPECGGVLIYSKREGE